MRLKALYIQAAKHDLSAAPEYAAFPTQRFAVFLTHDVPERRAVAGDGGLAWRMAVMGRWVVARSLSSDDGASGVDRMS